MLVTTGRRRQIGSVLSLVSCNDSNFCRLHNPLCKKLTDQVHSGDDVGTVEIGGGVPELLFVAVFMVQTDNVLVDPVMPTIEVAYPFSNTIRVCELCRSILQLAFVENVFDKRMYVISQSQLKTAAILLAEGRCYQQ